MTNWAQRAAFDPGALIAPLGFDNFFREHWERSPFTCPVATRITMIASSPTRIWKASFPPRTCGIPRSSSPR
jgi:hypothetical protein